MANSALQLLRQVAPAKNPDDQLTGAQVAAIEATAADFKTFLNGMLSQLKRIIHGNDSGDWDDDPVTAFGSDASLKALLTALAGVSADKLVSNAGEFAVPSLAVVGDLVYSTGPYASAPADNGSALTGPANGIILAKPTSTSATLAFAGRITGFAGLTTGSVLFLGGGGSIVTASGLPTSVGSAIQRIGIALSTTDVAFAPLTPIVL